MEIDPILAPAPPSRGYVDVNWRFCCAACGQLANQAFNWLPGTEVRVPELPNGWWLLNQAVYCPLHKIKIENVK